MQTGRSCIHDSGDFNDKMKRIVCEGSFLVTADVVSLHPSIPHNFNIKKTIFKNKSPQGSLLMIWLS